MYAMINNLTDLIGAKKTIVFLGESGCGKSEIAINFAFKLKAETNRKIHFFDMDQTKPLFRSRDIANQISSAGIEFHCNTNESIEDIASVAPGVIEAIGEPYNYVVMDIGGNEHGARMIGQFSKHVNNENGQIFFLINPYRPWSRDYPGITETVERITCASRTPDIRVISNPNFGLQTTAEDVIRGNDKLRALLNGRLPISCVCVHEHLYAELVGKIDTPLIPIRIYILYPWQEQNPV